MFKRNGAGNMNQAPAQPEVRPASADELADLGLMVSAGWHGIKQGRQFLPEGFTSRVDGDRVMLRVTHQANLPFMYDEMILALNESLTTSWTIAYVSSRPHLVDEVPQGFERTTTTYPLVEGVACTREEAICKPDVDSVLQPIAEPVTQDLGPATNVQVDMLNRTLLGMGVMGGGQAAA